MSRSSFRPTARPVRPALEALEGREVPAAVGALDPSFGTNGRFAAFPTINTVSGVAVDGLGRTVLAGSIAGAGGFDVAVIRLNPNGTPDTSFGGDGLVTLDLAGADDRGRGVAVDAANNVVVAGQTTGAGNQALFVRFRAADGAPDTTFGGGGTGVRLFTPPAGFNNLIPNDVVIDGNGRAVATGSALATVGLVNSVAVMRLTADGSALDPGFNGGAVKLVSFVFGLGSNSLGQQVVLSGSNIVVGGQTNNGAAGARTQFAALRLEPDGDLDPTFGTGNGAVSFNVGPAGSDDIAFAAAVDPAGSVYLAGLVNAADQRLGVAKLEPDGDLDPTFGTGGAFVGQVGVNFSEGDAVAVQPSGRVVVMGTANASATDFDFFALGFLPNGTFDPGFNPAGPIPGFNRFDFGANAAEFAGAGTITPQGRVVIAGSDTTAGGARAARLIGTVEKAPPLAAGGSTDGAAAVFTQTFATGQYGGAAAATVAAFGTTAVNARTATGDVNGDRVPDTIVVTGPGTGVRFAVVSGVDNTTVLIPPTDPFGGGFTGGGFVAAGDFDNDGRAEVIVTPDQGGGPRVVIFSRNPDGTLAARASFLGIDDAAFRGGARAAGADVNGDGVADLAVAAGFLGGPRAALFDGTTVFGTPTRLVGDFFAFPGPDAVTLRNGVFVAAGDVNGDGFADLVFGGGPGGAPRVFILSGQLVSANNVAGAQAAPISNFFVAGNSTDRGGVRLAAKDADGDGKADVAAASGASSAARVRVYLGRNVTSAAEPTTFQDVVPFGGATLADGVYVG
ncbi:MAG: FG-GAP-like repeat-containing protein [Gemmataceae bacterium]|nr:FG-GAP-like repeat-containing protein [Gemmataceae bacterium]